MKMIFRRLEYQTYPTMSYQLHQFEGFSKAKVYGLGLS